MFKALTRLVALLSVSAHLCVPSLRAAVPPQSEAFRAFYNLEYDRAISLFEKAVAEQPDSPDAWNHLSQAIFSRRLYLEGALQSEFVGKSNSFLRRPKVVMPLDEERRFLDANSRAMRLSLDRLAKDPNDAAALYALGIAYAHSANFRFLCQKAYIDALRDATRARNLHNRLRQVQPGYPDAILIPAMYDYIGGSLPVMVRILASMAGFSGNRSRGIAGLQRAVLEGKKTGVEARVLLCLVYNREGKPAMAVPLMAELVEAFPRNYLYRSESVLLLARAGRKAEALRAVEGIEQMKRDGAPELASMDLAKVKRLRELVEQRLRGENE